MVTTLEEVVKAQRDLTEEVRSVSPFRERSELLGRILSEMQTIEVLADRGMVDARLRNSLRKLARNLKLLANANTLSDFSLPETKIVPEARAELVGDTPPWERSR